jgi:hypothetical protein
MAGSNISFCVLHTPHIAAQLKALPRTSRHRRVVEAQIEALSRESLVAVDKLLAIMERGLIVKAGVRAAQRRGVHCGRKAIVVDKVKILELHLRGKSIRAIASELHLKKDIVHQIIKRATA